VNYKEAKLLLIKKLTMKSYCTGELRRWFHDKGVDETIAEQLLQEFQQQGYLDDSAWLASFVRIQRAKRYGSRTIALKLKQKGFSNEEVAELLHDKSEEEGAIQKLLETRYRTRDLKNPRERQKVVASLLRRGFQLERILTFCNLQN
jgi:regulatory protein